MIGFAAFINDVDTTWPAEKAYLPSVRHTSVLVTVSEVKQNYIM
jgi:hypothetical protein